MLVMPLLSGWFLGRRAGRNGHDRSESHDQVSLFSNLSRELAVRRSPRKHARTVAQIIFWFEKEFVTFLRNSFVFLKHADVSQIIHMSNNYILSFLMMSLKLYKYLRNKEIRTHNNSNTMCLREWKG